MYQSTPDRPADAKASLARVDGTWSMESKPFQVTDTSNSRVSPVCLCRRVQTQAAALPTLNLGTAASGPAAISQRFEFGVLSSTPSRGIHRSLSTAQGAREASVRGHIRQPPATHFVPVLPSPPVRRKEFLVRKLAPTGEHRLVAAIRVRRARGSDRHPPFGRVPVSLVPQGGPTPRCRRGVRS
jgi:hypothetical protein